MCRFCTIGKEIVKKITVCKYEQNEPKMDGIFDRVEIGRTIIQRKPRIKIETNKSTVWKEMPVEFTYCPHCGRKIKECEKQ